MSDYTIDPERYADIELDKGHHGLRSQGMCLMEAVAYLVGEEHTDKPECVDSVLGAYGRSLNDVLPKARRQELRALIPSLPGTADDGEAYARSQMAHRWLYRHWLPTVLETSWARWAQELAADLRKLNDAQVYAQTRAQVQRIQFGERYEGLLYSQTPMPPRPLLVPVEESVVKATVDAWGLGRDTSVSEMVRWLHFGQRTSIRDLYDIAAPAMEAVLYSDPDFRRRPGGGHEILRLVTDLALVNSPGVRAELGGRPAFDGPEAHQAARVLDGLRDSAMELFTAMVKAPAVPQ